MRSTVWEGSPSILLVMMMRMRLVATVVVGLVAGRGLAQAAQGFGALDVSQPVGKTVAQIVERMGQQESAFAAARQDYTFKQDVKFDTISEDTGKPDGEYHQITDISFSPEGRREEHVVFAPQNTIQRVIMTESDFKDIEDKLPFVLTAPELPKYDLTYLGKQKVDELDTYVFDCAPKMMEKKQRYFQGKVWVDQQDDEIVLINGMTVPQDTRPGHEDLSPPYTTYYEQVDGKYWFPVYTKAEGTLHFAAQRGALSNDVHVKTTVRYTDYKRFRASVTIHYNGEEIPGATPPVVEKPGTPPPL
jgi:hypothetical protein